VEHVTTAALVKEPEGPQVPCREMGQDGVYADGGSGTRESLPQNLEHSDKGPILSRSDARAYSGVQE